MKTAEVIELIKARRSIFPRQFDGMEISKNEIEILLEAANWAPTHRMTQPWRFHVLGGKRKADFANFIVEKLGEKKAKEKIELSDKIILLCFTNNSDSVPMWEELAAFSMAVQNMWLVCKSLNIGAYWSSPVYAKEVNQFTELLDGSICKGFFYMGKFDYNKEIKSHRVNVEDKVKWELD